MPQPLTVALAGLGAIGWPVAQALDRGMDGLALTAIAVAHPEKAAEKVRGFRVAPKIVPAGELAAHADIVVECLPAAFFAEVADPAVAAGRIFMPLSVGALLRHDRLVADARKSGARIIVPTGALVGLDAVRAAAEGDITSVSIETRKPPGGLKSAPHIQKMGFDLTALPGPLEVFSGSARDAAVGFPANINVAVALSLAGIGPDLTEVRIFADPGVTRNTHIIRVDSDATRFELKIEGVPSPENPATGLLTPLSVMATLRGLVSPLKVGT